MSIDLPDRNQVAAIAQVAAFQPTLAGTIIFLSLFAAMLEGVGLSFLIPIIRIARDGQTVTPSGDVLQTFVAIYDLFGVPFTLEYVISGVAIVMVTRYVASFLVSWSKVLIQERYVRHLQTEAFNRALDAEISYFDQQGSDEILNAIVTQANQAGKIISRLVQLIEQGLVSFVYLSIALYLAPILTVAAGVLLGGLVLVFRSVFESGYAVGDQVANANERVQTAAQAGMQGIRDVKAFGMQSELFGDFRAALDQAVSSRILLSRNQAALDKLYRLATALTVFVLIYVALQIAALDLAELGVFLFAMFRLAPRISNLNNQLYRLEGTLPHLVRTQEFIAELNRRTETERGRASPPTSVRSITFEDVSFGYDGGEEVLDGLSLSVDAGEFVGFVGPSGAGKSTIMSLLIRMYEPDSGRILADGRPIDGFDIQEWREHVSVVRQQPFIFNDTLRRNITIGSRNATRSDIQRVCEIAQVTEFLDSLPNGYDTVLGDNGVRLSGGQKQRVALARALLKDADFLILDEATSDLDTNIEESVHQAIESMDREYAMLVIAHRLSTVVNADRIYTITDGRIEDVGTHDALLCADGTYADLYATQR